MYTVTVIQVSYNVDLLPTNANLGRIMRIMEINIWLLEPLFILNIQIFNITFDYWYCPKLCLESRKWFPKIEITFSLQVGICYILPYNQIIKRNNQIIKMNNQIFRIKLACVRSNDSVHNWKIAAHILETIQQLKKEYRNAVIPMRETLTHPYNQLANDGIITADYLLEEVYTTLNEHTVIRNSIFSF